MEDDSDRFATLRRSVVPQRFCEASRNEEVVLQLQRMPPKIASSKYFQKQSTSLKPISRNQSHCSSTEARIFAARSGRSRYSLRTSATLTFSPFSRRRWHRCSLMASLNNSSPHGVRLETCSALRNTPPLF